MSCYGNYCTRQFQPFNQKEEFSPTYTKASRYGESFAAPDLRPNVPNRVSYIQSQQDLNDQSRQFLPSLNGSNLEHYKTRSESPCACNCHMDYEDCVCSCHSPNHRVYLHQPIYDQISSDKDTGLTEELSELRRENQLLKEQLHSTRRDKEYADAYINELQRDLSNRRVRAFQDKAKRSSSVAGNKPDSFMLNRSFDVLNLVGEVANQDDNKPETVVRGAPEYYYEKIPDYNSLINSQKKFLESLKKSEKPKGDRRQIKESEKSDIYMTEPQNLSSSDLKALSQAENSQGFENSRSEIFGKYTPEIIDRTNRFNPGSGNNEGLQGTQGAQGVQQNPKMNKKVRGGPKGPVQKSQNADTKNLVPSFQGNPPNNLRGKGSPSLNEKLKPSFQGKAGQNNQRTKNIPVNSSVNSNANPKVNPKVNPNNGVQEINKDIDNYRRLFNGKGNSAYGYRPGITDLDANRSYTYMVGNYDRYGNNLPTFNKKLSGRVNFYENANEPNDPNRSGQGEYEPYDIEQNGPYDSNNPYNQIRPYESTNNFYPNDTPYNQQGPYESTNNQFPVNGPYSQISPYESTNNPYPDFYATAEDARRPDGTRIPGSNFGPGGKNYYTNDPSGLPNSQINPEDQVLRGTNDPNEDEEEDPDMYNTGNTDGGKGGADNTKNKGLDKKGDGSGGQPDDEFIEEEDDDPRKEGVNIPKEVELCDENGNPFTYNGKEIKGIELMPYLDENGQNVMDENDRFLFLGPDGRGVSQDKLEPVFTDDGQCLVNKDNHAILGIDNRPLFDDTGMPITETEPIEDAKDVPKAVVMTKKKWKKENNKGLAYHLNGTPVIDPKTGANINPEDLTIKLDKEGKPEKDSEGNIKVYGPDGNEIKNINAFPLLDEEGKPKKEDGKYVFVNNMGKRLDENRSKTPSQKGSQQGATVSKKGTPRQSQRHSSKKGTKRGTPQSQKGGSKKQVNPYKAPQVENLFKYLGIRPLLDENGNLVLDENGDPIFVGADGKPVKNIGILPILDGDGRPRVNDNDEMEFEEDDEENKVPYELKVDKQGNLVYDDEGKPIIVDKEGNEVKGTGLKPVLDEKGQPIKIDNNFIFVDDNLDVKPVLDEKGNVVTDKDGKPKVLVNGKVVSNLDILPKVDEDGKPVVDENGDYVFEKDPDAKEVPKIKLDININTPDKDGDKDNKGKGDKGIKNAGMDRDTDRDRVGSDDEIEEEEDDDKPKNDEDLGNMPLHDKDGQPIYKPDGTPLLFKEITPFIKSNGQVKRDSEGKPMILGPDGKPLKKELDISLYVDLNDVPMKKGGFYVFLDKDGNLINPPDQDERKEPEKDEIEEEDEEEEPLVNSKGKVVKDKNNKPVKPSDLKPLIGKDNKPIIDEKGEPVLLDKYNKPVKDIGITMKLDDDGHPVKDQEGNYVLVDKATGEPIPIRKKKKASKPKGKKEKYSPVKDYTPKVYGVQKHKNKNPAIQTSIDPALYSTKKLCKEHGGLGPEYYLSGKIGPNNSLTPCEACKMDLGHSRSGYSIMNFNPYKINERRKDVADYIPEYYLQKTFNEYDKNRRNYFNTLKKDFDASRERKISKNKVERNYYVGTLNDSQVKADCYACESGVANSLSGYSPMTFSPFNRRERRLKIKFSPEQNKKADKSRATSIDIYKNSMNTLKYKNAVNSTAKGEPSKTITVISRKKRKGNKTSSTNKVLRNGIKSNGAYYNIVSEKTSKKK